MPFIYKHIRLDTNQIFYIGIGKELKRAYSKQRRNKYWNNIVSKVGYKIEIIEEVDTWENACNKEKELISFYGRIDKQNGILVNMTDGGEGVVDMPIESRKSISDKLKISRLGANNPMYGKKGILNSFYNKRHTEEANEKNRQAHIGVNVGHKCGMAKKVIDMSNNTIYDCAKYAAENIDMRYGTLINMLSGHRKNKTSLKYL